MEKPIKPVEIEIQGKTAKQIIEAMIVELFKAGFHTAGYVCFGKWEAYACIQEKTNRPCILMRFESKLDFLLLGATNETYEQINQELSDYTGQTIFVEIANKTLAAIIVEIEQDLRANGWPENVRLKNLACQLGILETADHERAYVLDIDETLRFLLIGASEQFLKDLYQAIRAS